VHEKGSFIYAQLWALGRAADSKILERDGNYPYVSSYPMQLTRHDEVPRALTLPEIKEYVRDYAAAAKNAIAAGFDGVEIHGANGYLVDQFLQDVVNKRTDEYGGSVENRSRFGLEVVEAVVAAVGQDRTAIRLSPWSTYQGLFSSYTPSDFDVSHRGRHVQIWVWRILFGNLPISLHRYAMHTPSSLIFIS
jgi:NADPH2 dehydrogenase